MERDGGAGEVYRKLMALAAAMDGPLVREVATEWALKVVIPEAKERCPKRTGALAESIGIRVSELGISLSADKDYASFVHDGTSDNEANPFLEMAINNNLPLLFQMIEEEILRRYK